MEKHQMEQVLLFTTIFVHGAQVDKKCVAENDSTL